MVSCSLQLKLLLVTEDYRLFKNRYVCKDFGMESICIGSLHVLTSYNIIAYNSMFIRQSVSYVLSVALA